MPSAVKINLAPPSAPRGDSPSFDVLSFGTFSSPPDTDTTPPVVSSANIDTTGLALTIHWTEADSSPVLPSTGGTGLSLVGLLFGAATLSSVSTSGTTTTATISRAIYSDETVTLSGTSTNFTDSASPPNSVINFSGVAITNNSTVTSPPLAQVAPLVVSVSTTSITVTNPTLSLASSHQVLYISVNGSGTWTSASSNLNGTEGNQTIRNLVPGTEYIFRYISYGTGNTNGASSSVIKTRSSLYVTGAGNISCNGTYTYTGNDGNGKPYWTLNGNRHIYSLSGYWLIGGTLDDNGSTVYYYEQTYNNGNPVGHYSVTGSAGSGSTPNISDLPTSSDVNNIRGGMFVPSGGMLD